eukprot:1180547-Pyramimonas_sp.AAC.1
MVPCAVSRPIAGRERPRFRAAQGRQARARPPRRGSWSVRKEPKQRCSVAVSPGARLPATAARLLRQLGRRAKCAR